VFEVHISSVYIMSETPPRSRKGVPAWVEKAKLFAKVFLVLGALCGISGVALFTFSEAYPDNHRVGRLTYSQLGFWLIASGCGVILLSVIGSQICTCVGRKSIPPPPIITNSGMGTGYDEEDGEDTSLLANGSPSNKSPTSSRRL
jgi:hypothetical protein